MPERSVTVRLDLQPNVAGGMSIAGRLEAEKQRIRTMFEGLGSEVAAQERRIVQQSVQGTGGYRVGAAQSRVLRSLERSAQESEFERQRDEVQARI